MPALAWNFCVKQLGHRAVTVAALDAPGGRITRDSENGGPASAEFHSVRVAYNPLEVQLSAEGSAASRIRRTSAINRLTASEYGGDTSSTALVTS